MNNEKNLFEVAVRGKFRFPFKGTINVEDLCDLSHEDLDIVFKKLNSQLKQVKEESLLTTKTKEDIILDLKIQIVKNLFQEKLKEEEERVHAKLKKEQKQRIMEIMKTKQDEKLQNMSPEELQKLLDNM